MQVYLTYIKFNFIIRQAEVGVHMSNPLATELIHSRKVMNETNERQVILICKNHFKKSGQTIFLGGRGLLCLH